MKIVAITGKESIFSNVHYWPWSVQKPSLKLLLRICIMNYLLETRLTLQEPVTGFGSPREMLADAANFRTSS